MMNISLTIIEEFAAKAHKDQRRKFEDEPFIVHPVRVMKICSEYSQSLPVLAAALLHDVLEDTEVTEEELGSFLATELGDAESQKTMLLVKELTDQYVKSNYPKWDRRKRKQAEARRMATCHPDTHTVKYADIIDNSLTITNTGDSFALKYLTEVNDLLKFINKGNRELYERAKKTIQTCLKDIS